MFDDLKDFIKGIAQITIAVATIAETTGITEILDDDRSFDPISWIDRASWD